MINKTCLKCKKDFLAIHSKILRGGGKFCSVNCYRQSYSGHVVSIETRKKISDSNKGKKVSNSTREKIRQSLSGRDLGGYKRECKTCSKLFRCNPSDKTVNCSRGCSSQYFSQFKGEKSHSWQGGITPTHLLDRRGIQYKDWRKSVFERDNYTCQKTGQLGGELVVHHIKNFSKFPSLRFAINNGITLSKKSHNDFHKRYGKRNNTPEQLVEFLSQKERIISSYQPLFNIKKYGTI